MIDNTLFIIGLVLSGLSVMLFIMGICILLASFGVIKLG